MKFNNKIKLIQIIKHNFQCISSLNESEIKQLLKQYWLNEKTVNDNDIAYYQVQNKEYNNSIFILDKILLQYLTEL